MRNGAVHRTTKGPELLLAGWCPGYGFLESGTPCASSSPQHPKHDIFYRRNKIWKLEPNTDY